MGYPKASNPVLDTLELGRFLYPEFKNHRLNTLCKKFDIDLTQHHRAIYDAEATGYLMLKMLKDAMEKRLPIMISLMTIWVKETLISVPGHPIVR